MNELDDGDIDTGWEIPIISYFMDGEYFISAISVAIVTLTPGISTSALGSIALNI